MKTQKKDIKTPRLTGDQIVQKKLDEANAMLRKMDPAVLESLRQRRSDV